MALKSTAGRWVLAVAVLGSGMAFLDGTVVNVALPKIGSDLHASTGTLQWILNGYLLTLASLILLGGSLGDRYGRRRVFVIGVGLFTVASLLCAISPSATALVFARMLQGVGGALLTPGSLAMIEASFRPSDRAAAIGAWSGLGGVGDRARAAARRLSRRRGVVAGDLPDQPPDRGGGGDHGHPPRAGDARSDRQRSSRLHRVGAGRDRPRGLHLRPDRGAVQGSTPLVLVAGIVGVVALVAFLLAERRSANPMMPLGMFSSRQFSAANLVTFVVYAALGGVFFLLVAFLQISLGYSPIEAGAVLLPVTAIMLAFSARAGALAQRIGARIPLTVGPLVIAVGLLMMTRIGRGDDYLTSVLPAVLVFGAGLTLVVAPVTATVLAAADSRHSGIASGINNAVSRVAGPARDRRPADSLPASRAMTSTTPRRWSTASTWRCSCAPRWPRSAGSWPG